MATNDWADEASQQLAPLAKDEVRPFFTVDFGRQQDKDGISILVPEAQAPKVLERLRQQLPDGLVAFIGTTKPADEDLKGVEIVVATGKDQFDCVRLAQSEAPNFELTNADLIRKLRTYHKQLDIDIFHAESDTITFVIRKPPADWLALADDIGSFCPDIVDQGVGTVEALAKFIEKSKQVSLWWD
jgi:hypothetical protein